MCYETATDVLFFCLHFQLAFEQQQKGKNENALWFVEAESKPEKKIQLKGIKVMETFSESKKAHKDHQDHTTTEYSVNDAGLAQIKCGQWKEYSVS